MRASHIPHDPAPDAAAAHAAISGLADWLRSGMIGAETLVERLLIGLLADGHVLLEGAPGLGKTRAVKLLAQGIGIDFARIQCTPDLMPADLTGAPVYRPGSGDFEFVPGPVFNGLVLVDEINRAPPKAQSALLEAMAERQVTVMGETRALPDPFLVVATQNPIEYEGTYPLPEAQLDRFLLHVALGQPDAAAERRILDLAEAERIGAPKPPDKLSADILRAGRAAAAAVHAAPALKDHIIRIVGATRANVEEIEHPASPRGAIALMAAAKARAFLAGRDHAAPEDVAELAHDTLAHRLILTWRAQADGVRPRDITARILNQNMPL